MKRILSLLAAIGITATASSASVSCTTIHHHRGQVLSVTGRPTFSIASVGEIHSDDWKPGMTTNTIYVSGIDLDKLLSLDPDSFSITPVQGADDTLTKNVKVASVTVEPSNTDVVLTLAGDGIKVPNTVNALEADQYTVSYNDKKGFSIPGVSLYVFLTKNDDQ